MYLYTEQEKKIYKKPVKLQKGCVNFGIEEILTIDKERFLFLSNKNRSFYLERFFFSLTLILGSLFH